MLAEGGEEGRLGTAILRGEEKEILERGKIEEDTLAR